MTLTSNKRVLLVRLLIPVFCFVGVALGAIYVRWLMETDPFAKFRRAAQQVNPVAVRLEDTAMRMYEGPKLAGQCQVAQIDVMRDRNQFKFYGVTAGLYKGAKGELRFKGPEGQYHAGMRLLKASPGARVWNADMDLSVDGFEYDERRGLLTVPGKVLGHLYDGEVVLNELTYSPATGDYKTGPIAWKGEIELSKQTGQGRRVTWNVIADDSDAKGDIINYSNFQATDGEVILKGPKAEWNRKTDVMHATGRVLYFGLDANVACDEVTVYRKEKRAVLTGNVTMLVKPKDDEKLEVVEIAPFRPAVPEEILKNRPVAPDRASEEQKKQEEDVRSTKNLRKYPISVHAEKIEYWYAKGTRHAEITGSPQAYQELPTGGWRRAWAPKALYDGEKETLRMVSTEGKKDTRILTSVGDDLLATWFQVSTKDNTEDEWEGHGIEGEVVVNEEENRPRKNPPNQKPPPGKPPLKGGIGGE